MSDVLPPVKKINKETAPSSPAEPRSRARQVMRLVGIGLITAAFLLAWYLAILYFGWQSGQTLLNQKRETELQTLIDRQITLARENIDDGSYNLALRRLEWVLERAPDQPDALKLKEQVETAVGGSAPPQPSIQISEVPATPTPQLLPSPTAGLIDDPLSELQRIRRLSVNQAWSEVVPALVAFQHQFPDYERVETDRLIYEAYIKLGLDMLEGEQVEVGLFYLEQAEKLGDLSQEVLDYRTWAELYLQGLAFYDVNWGAATYYFRDLCLAAPFYQSSCERLHEALEAFGDQSAFAQEWCQAEGLYEEALTHGRTQSLLEKTNQAHEACLLATPTPLPTTTLTAPITNTLPITNGLRSFETPTPVK